jgi:FkbM family methyltransferase
MISRILKFVYKKLPTSFVKVLGRSSFLKPLRDYFLRSGKSKRLLTVTTKWGEQTFFYTGDFKSAIKAERKGIESSLLRLSIKLVRELKGKEDRAIVLDIGSSYGYLSTVWALSICSKGRVFAFEANPSVYATALDTAVRNSLSSRLKYHQFAVYKTDGVLEMNMHDDTHASLSDAGKNKVKIKAITIDTFCQANDVPKVDLIKVDVDGPEWEVLQGAQNVINRDQPILIIESNGDQRIIRWLISNSYEVFDLSMKKNESDIPPPNIVAIPK